MNKMNEIRKIDEVRNIFGDDIAYVEKWDFSRANLNEENRIAAITTVASICYDNPNVIGKESLYNRLAAEAAGLPSSSFEFVPVLLTDIKVGEILNLIADKELPGEKDIPNILKYGEIINYDSKEYLLTNYRALFNDSTNFKLDLLKLFNTEEECEIISKFWNTYLMKMDLNTSKQHNRHRIQLQELSRRYVSGKKTKLEFYASSDIKDKKVDITTTELYVKCVDHYFGLLEQGIKPQSARRVLPSSLYTTVWSAFLPFQLDNYLKLRDTEHAQQEIRWLAQAIKKLNSEK